MNDFELHTLITSSYNLDELQTLCLMMGIPYEEFPGTTISGKARELILYCSRHRCRPQLERAVRQAPPKDTIPIEPTPLEQLETVVSALLSPVFETIDLQERISSGTMRISIPKPLQEVYADFCGHFRNYFDFEPRCDSHRLGALIYCSIEEEMGCTVALERKSRKETWFYHILQDSLVDEEKQQESIEMILGFLSDELGVYADRILYKMVSERFDDLVDDVTDQVSNLTPAYVDFDLHVTSGGSATANSNQGQASATIPTEIPAAIQSALLDIKSRNTSADDLKRVGTAFYDWLFPPDIHTHFTATEAVARQQGAKIRLRLRIEAEAMASLPLELAYREAGGYFLAVNPDTVLSRFLNLPLPQGQVRRQEGALHVLTIVASPDDPGLAKLDPDEWEGIVREALSEPLQQGRVTFAVVKRATLRNIRRALLKQPPNVVQFVGHGVYKDGKGYLALVDADDGGPKYLDDAGFANLFLGTSGNLGLVSLTTCEGGASDDPQGFSGIAPQLVQRGIPAVVAMQYKVRIKTARLFLEEFYLAITEGRPVDWATQWARNAISLDFGMDDREFATPVLYMRAKDGRVF